jgi:hypothetical protein
MMNNIRLIMKSEPARWAKPGARILHRYGRLVPSLHTQQISGIKAGVKVVLSFAYCDSGARSTLIEAKHSRTQLAGESSLKIS